MTSRRALVLGGTGMLADCVAALLAEGWQVVTPTRHPREIHAEPETSSEPPRPGAAARAALGPPGQVPTGQVPTGQAPTGQAPAGRTPTDRRREPAVSRWVAADWAEPDRLASTAAEALGGPADLLVAWVRPPHREAVLRAVAPLLASTAPVVEVRGSGEPSEPPVLAGHPTHVVVLGLGQGGGVSRWLTHGEISTGVFAVARRALAGDPPGIHLIGEPGAWRR
ncbi:hypothetical protein LX15_004852 [Streptoalloteichus tenebrarius]|uniref:Uncharacterized protein n=1 Tax=Streptoalloteichus tenebrarius (strain ATCC 17920 / DSM 40477 / JCM 4838 / CBS 697.72 / NBRC 16177 / NCIMB 11028 / NRRL B-12390 / A12253. 1 / ISP 5477) TaxID=1933 RepID=A0ABT1I019_STRSD|nr:hypothetical protein [Streptoalloteichus tenebrarius]MCP2261132.1 hypothetical protein [Streptoalloteichus tenebrarius]BFF03959.1 hypothetical protein GCM10020241_56340 [Streptoalloteichus tenebrarius]